MCQIHINILFRLTQCAIVNLCQSISIHTIISKHLITLIIRQCMYGLYFVSLCRSWDPRIYFIYGRSPAVHVMFLYLNTLKSCSPCNGVILIYRRSPAVHAMLLYLYTVEILQSTQCCYIYIRWKSCSPRNVVIFIHGRSPVVHAMLLYLYTIEVLQSEQCCYIYIRYKSCSPRNVVIFIHSRSPVVHAMLLYLYTIEVL